MNLDIGPVIFSFLLHRSSSWPRKGRVEFFKSPPHSYVEKEKKKHSNTYVRGTDKPKFNI